MWDVAFRSNTAPAERQRAPEERARLPQLPPAQCKQEHTYAAVFPHTNPNQTLTKQSRRLLLSNQLLQDRRIKIVLLGPNRLLTFKQIIMLIHHVMLVSLHANWMVNVGLNKEITLETFVGKSNSVGGVKCPLWSGFWLMKHWKKLQWPNQLVVQYVNEQAVKAGAGLCDNDRVSISGVRENSQFHATSLNLFRPEGCD